MANDGSIVINVDFDTSPMEKGAKKVETVAQRMENTFKRVAKVVAAAFSIKALADFGKQAIELASDMDEVQNVVDTAFGELTYQVEAFADTAIEKLGLSKLAAKQMASTYMAMGKGIGVADQASANMAINATARAADIMSFYNLTADRANTMMKSIWTGETESFKAIGVVMTEANLQNFAYTQGVNKKISAMTEAEKVQLRYNYVMEQTALADGDFAKTSGSWANQVRMLSEKFKEFLSIVGSGLIQVLTPFVQMLNAIMSKLISFATTLSSVFSALFGKGESQATTQGKIAAQTAVAAENEGKLADNAKAAGKATKEAGKEAEKAMASFDTINTLQTADESEDLSADLPGVFADAAYNTPLVFDDVTLNFGGDGNDTSRLDGIVEKLEPIITAFDALNVELAKIGEFATNVGRGFLENFLEPIGNWTIGEGLPRFIDALRKMAENVNWSAITNSLNNLWSKLSKFMVDTIGKGLVWFVEHPLTDLFNFFTQTNENGDSIVSLAIDAIAAAIEACGQIIDAVKPAFEWLYNNFLLPLLGLTWEVAITGLKGLKTALVGVGEAAQTMGEMSGTGLQKTGSLFSELWENTLSPVWENNILPLFSAIGQSATDLYNNHLMPLWTEHVKPMIDAIVQNIANNWENGIAPILSNMGQQLQDLWQNIIMPFGIFLKDVFVVFVENCFDAIARLGSSLCDTFGEIFKNFEDAYAGFCDFVTGVFTDNLAMAFDGLVSSCKELANAVIALVEGLNNALVRPLNAFMEKINLSINSFGGLFGQNWNVDLTFSEAKIPRLATGAVIPPNREFLAVLGDQSRGTNVEAPLETMVEAFTAAASSINGGVTSVDISFSGNEGQLLRYLYDGLKVTQSKKGTQLIG